MGMCEIRPAAPPDAASIVALLARMDAEDGANRCHQIDAQMLSALLGDPAGRFGALVADDGRALIGLLAFQLVTRGA